MVDDGKLARRNQVAPSPVKAPSAAGQGDNKSTPPAGSSRTSPEGIRRSDTSRSQAPNLGCCGSRTHHQIVKSFRLLRDSGKFQTFIILIIFVAGVQVGIATYPVDPESKLQEVLEYVFVDCFSDGCTSVTCLARQCAGPDRVDHFHSRDRHQVDCCRPEAL